MRDLQKTADLTRGNVSRYYDMSLLQLQELVNRSKQGEAQLLEALSAAFSYGYVMGARAQKSGQVPCKLL